MENKTSMPTLSDDIIQSLIKAGVSHLFGMPGGGSNADLVEAAGKVGLPFIMAHTETAAAFMACAQAEISGKPGACLATLGPGAASIVNGVAHAFLDRIPLLVFTDCHSDNLQTIMQHQTLNQTELFRPITKWSTRLATANAAKTVSLAAALALEPRRGPVHLDYSASISATNLSDGNPAFSDGVGPFDEVATKVEDLSLIPLEVEHLLRKARRPLVLLGLDARNVSSVLSFCESYNLPALVTYKAKGVIPYLHRCFAGILTNGALERPVLEQADLFIAIGLDPVELLATPWNNITPLISCNTYPMKQTHLPVTAALVGEINPQLELLGTYLNSSNEWDFNWLQLQVNHQRSAMRPEGEPNTLLPHRVVELVAAALSPRQVTVDAGAHMFPAMGLWPTNVPNGILISNGLATMGFALPAAIGAALLDPTQSVVALTGDGGLLMCLSELKTAVRENLSIRVIVFDDGELSLIKIKQEQRGYKTNGISLGPINWLALGEAFGIAVYSADDEAEFEQVMAKIAGHKGPVMVAAKINPLSYRSTIRALRG